MALFADYHVHSDISPDSGASMESLLASARERSITEICFTDHCDPDYPYENWPLPDLSRYFANLEEARRSFPEIQIRAGIEMGMVPSARSFLRNLAQENDFDFIILSRHIVDGIDPLEENYFVERSQREGEQRYLEAVLDDITHFSDFDVCGHLGFVDRGLTLSDELKNATPFTYADFPDFLDAILTALIENGKGIEINTRSYKYFGSSLPHPSIVRRYAQLGGDIVTVGSDAHNPSFIGNDFSKAEQILKDSGLRYVCTFSNRQPIYNPIS